MNNVIIIAEAGVNHNGSIEMAKELILEASRAGADYVKFQTFKAEKLASVKAKKAQYQQSSEESENQLEMLKKLELSEKDSVILKEFAESKKIKFLSTGFDEESVDELDKLGIDIFKIPSGEITNKPLLEHIGKKGKKIIISTGMSDMSDIANALNVLGGVGVSKKDITILHCNTEYPTPMEDVNLKAMLSIQKEFGVDVGYSDHTLGIEVPIAAVAMGAQVIEKHFTLDTSLEGPDHAASLEPQQLKKMIEGVRNIEKATSGSGVKEPSISESKNIHIARKSIHTSKQIMKGEEITKDKIIMLRPGDGISPMLIDDVLGKNATRDIDIFEQLSWEDIQ